MNIHYFQHVAFEDLASIEPWARGRGHRVSVTRFHHAEPLPRLDDVDWLVVMGGPMNIYEHDKFPWLAAEKQFIRQAITAGKRVLGICLGAQLIADVLGAKVTRNPHKEIGWFPIRKTADAMRSRVCDALPAELDAFQWHGDTFGLPPGALHVARSEACDNQAFVFNERVVGLQFHLETTKQAAARLVENCADELVPGPFVQTANAMLGDERRFERINATMAALLERLEAMAG